MPKLRIKRFYYRNDRVHAEIREVGGEFHGLNRTWHFNGQLAEELRYRHGRLHGISRLWDENGRLLGSFTMNHGTGTQRYWHQNGRLRLEINSLNGKFFGRTRTWLRDGTLVQEIYYISNVDVTRVAYQKAARKHPDWPRHEGEPAGKVAREGRALERRQHELFIESLLEKSHAEARQWLSAAKHPDLRSLAKFRTATAAFHFVETIYAAGAETVIVLPIYPGRRGKLFADWLLVKLPKTPSRRKALRKLCQDFCDQRDGAMLPDKDIGESHLFMRLA
ncbi:MAG: hypothetical protein ABSF10_14540 [Verrucomicrobiota bacterium]|jgi:hypothetical protein